MEVDWSIGMQLVFKGNCQSNSPLLPDTPMKNCIFESLKITAMSEMSEMAPLLRSPNASISIIRNSEVGFILKSFSGI
jgi:hypothetical protein